MTQPNNIASSDQLREALRHNVVHVSFRKADGSVRHMQATLQESHLPASPVTIPADASDPNLFKVWDMEKQAWRSFRADRLDTWQIAT